MNKMIIIKTNKVSMQAELNDSNIAVNLFRALPIKARVNTWGDEIYFPIPVISQNEDPVESVQLGDLAYWPPMNCFCIFFGQTPVSKANEIRPASDVTLLGRLLGKPQDWKTVKNGEEIIIEKLV